MLCYDEWECVKHLNNTGKSAKEISRVIENRRIESIKRTNIDVLTDVYEVLFLLLRQKM